MELDAAERLAKGLISIHNPVVTFAWSRTKHAFGDYDWQKRELRLSRILTPIRPNHEVRETIMHEIAHSLTPGDGHGRRWKAQMLRFGLKPERCSRTVADLDNLKGNWYGVCPVGHKTRYWLRKPRLLRRSCAKCDSTKFNEAYLISWHVVS